MCASTLLSVGCYYRFVRNFWGCSLGISSLFKKTITSVSGRLHTVIYFFFNFFGPMSHCETSSVFLRYVTVAATYIS